MIYVAHTAHGQFLGLVFGCVGWILTMFTAGRCDWRLWLVSDLSVITSGVASVGIWRVCFDSHSREVCRAMGVADDFVPVEIAIAQVLIMVAVILGLAGNISASFAVRSVYFSVESRNHVSRLFLLAGTLYVLTATCSMVPLVWNMDSVLKERIIAFPPEFQLPPEPVEQKTGVGIAVGIVASALNVISGMLFLCYRLPHRALESTAQPTREDQEGSPTGTQRPQNGDVVVHQAKDNPAFQTEEDL